MYLLIIDKNMRNIYKLIHSSAFVYIAFFPILPYIPHKATQHFVEVCFRFVQTAVILLSFSLLHNFYLKLSSVTISYILFWCIMSTLLTKMLK